MSKSPGTVFWSRIGIGCERIVKGALLGGLTLQGNGFVAVPSSSERLPVFPGSGRERNHSSFLLPAQEAVGAATVRSWRGRRGEHKSRCPDSSVSSYQAPGCALQSTFVNPKAGSVWLSALVRGHPLPLRTREHGVLRGFAWRLSSRRP